MLIVKLPAEWRVKSEERGPRGEATQEHEETARECALSGCPLVSTLPSQDEIKVKSSKKRVRSEASGGKSPTRSVVRSQQQKTYFLLNNLAEGRLPYENEIKMK